MTDNKKIEIVVCMGSSCFARGNDKNLDFIEKYIKENKLEANIELIGSRCEDKCAQGPNILINGIEYKEATEKKIKVVLDEIAKRINKTKK